MVKGGYGGVAGSLLNKPAITATGGKPAPLPATTSDYAKFFPKAKMGGEKVFIFVSGNHYYAASDTNFIYSNTHKANMFQFFDIIAGQNIFSAFEMYQIDSKIDDGLPATGNMRDNYTADWGGGIYQTDDFATTGYACTTGSGLTQTYDLSPATANAKNCFEMDFLF